jgi:hypothetical protein
MGLNSRHFLNVSIVQVGRMYWHFNICDAKLLREMKNWPSLLEFRDKVYHSYSLRMSNIEFFHQFLLFMYVQHCIVSRALTLRFCWPLLVFTSSYSSCMSNIVYFHQLVLFTHVQHCIVSPALTLHVCPTALEINT